MLLGSLARQESERTVTRVFKFTMGHTRSTTGPTEDAEVNGRNTGRVIPSEEFSRTVLRGFFSQVDHGGKQKHNTGRNTTKRIRVRFRGPITPTASHCHATLLLCFG